MFCGIDLRPSVNTTVVINPPRLPPSWITPISILPLKFKCFGNSITMVGLERLVLALSSYDQTPQVEGRLRSFIKDQFPPEEEQAAQGLFEFKKHDEWLESTPTHLHGPPRLVPASVKCLLQWRYL
jgi:hypothetical protein